MAYGKTGWLSGEKFWGAMFLYDSPSRRTVPREGASGSTRKMVFVNPLSPNPRRRPPRS